MKEITIRTEEIFFEYLMDIVRTGLKDGYINFVNIEDIK